MVKCGVRAKEPGAKPKGIHKLQPTRSGFNLDRGGPQVGVPQLDLTCVSVLRPTGSGPAGSGPAGVEQMAWGLASLCRWGLAMC